MNKFYAILIGMCCPFALQSQSFIESFETDGEGTRYESNNFTSECNTDWFRRLQDGACPSTPNANFRDLATDNAIGEDGIFYFGASDTDQASLMIKLLDF